MNSDTIQILLVEDSPSDVELTVEAMREAKVANQLSVVADGVEAMGFLRQLGEHAAAPRPDLILLDLNLPARVARKCSRRSAATKICRQFP